MRQRRSQASETSREGVALPDVSAAPKPCCAPSAELGQEFATPPIAQAPGLKLPAAAIWDEDSVRSAAQAYGAAHWFTDDTVCGLRRRWTALLNRSTLKSPSAGLTRRPPRFAHPAKP